MGSLSLLQGIFPTQGSNPDLLHFRWILYQLSHKENPWPVNTLLYKFPDENEKWIFLLETEQTFGQPNIFLFNIDVGCFGRQLIIVLLFLLFSSTVVSNSVTPWTAAHQASLSFTVSWGLLKLMPIESVMPFNHLILCHPLLFLPSIFPGIRVFSNKLALYIRWSKYWSFSISPSNEHSGLLSYGTDWFDLLAVQGTLKSLLKHHNSKASILWHSTFFMV